MTEKPIIDDVTLSRKRYTWEWVFVCAGCDLLASSRRSDALTCSTTCRVRAHRSGRIKKLCGLCDLMGLTDENTGKPKPEFILHADAIKRLCPEMEVKIIDGSLTVYQAMPHAYSEFMKLVNESCAA